MSDQKKKVERRPWTPMSLYKRVNEFLSGSNLSRQNSIDDLLVALEEAIVEEVLGDGKRPSKGADAQTDA